VKSGVVNKWDGTDRRNPEYGLAAKDDFHGSVTKEIRHRDVTDRGSVTRVPPLGGNPTSSLQDTPALSDKEETELMVEEQKEWWQND